jgi:hypothetical protein
MSNCNDYWCEFYGKGGEQCDRCVKKDAENEPSQLRVMLNKRARDIAEGANNTKGQER